MQQSPAPVQTELLKIDTSPEATSMSGSTNYGSETENTCQDFVDAQQDGDAMDF